MYNGFALRSGARVGFALRSGARVVLSSSELCCLTRCMCRTCIQITQHTFISETHCLKPFCPIKITLDLCRNSSRGSARSILLDVQKQSWIGQRVSSVPALFSFFLIYPFVAFNSSKLPKPCPQFIIGRG
jgi:hypothetical protein